MEPGALSSPGFLSTFHVFPESSCAKVSRGATLYDKYVIKGFIVSGYTIGAWQASSDFVHIGEAEELAAALT